jgi:hypothetical protein
MWKFVQGLNKDVLGEYGGKSEAGGTLQLETLKTKMSE